MQCSDCWRLALLLAASPSQAQLRLDITQGVRDAVPIAVVPFGGQAEGAATDVAAVIANDLRMSGRFAPLERRDMVARPTPGERDPLRGLAAAASDFIVVGRVEAERRELRAAQRAHRRLAARPAAAVDERGLRATAHRIADLVFERLTGIPGAFSTRIAYVAVDGRPPASATG